MKKTVTDFTGVKYNCDCIGCAIAMGALTPPGGLILDYPSAILAADPEIPIPGFLIITLKRHKRSFTELDDTELKDISGLIRQGERAIRALGLADEITLVQEERSRHFHIWLLPWSASMSPRYESGIAAAPERLADARQNASPEQCQQTIDAVQAIRAYLQAQ